MKRVFYGWWIGIALVGTSLGGMFFPQSGTRLIQEHGSRSAFQLEVVAPIVLLVVIALVVRNRPSDCGL